MEWIVIGLVLALAMGLFGVPYALLFKPWRVKRLAYWLMARSPRYRSYVWRLLMGRMVEANKKVAASTAGLVAPMQRLGAAFEEFNKAWSRVSA